MTLIESAQTALVWVGLRKPQDSRSLSRPIRVVPTPGNFAGGRLSADTQFLSLVTGMQMLAPLSADDQWRNQNLDANTLSKISPRRLIELLADVSPDVSKALWDFLLMMNSGWECKAFKVGAERDNPNSIDPRAQAAIDTFLSSLHGPFTSDKVIPVDTIIATLNMGLFMRGALLAELVLDEAGRMPIDIATPDPYTVAASTLTDPSRGRVWQIGQYQNGQWIPLDRPTIFYIPLHPLPGRPFGRSLAAPAIFSTLFLIGTLHDLRRVVQQQGYPRLDIEIDFDKMRLLMPSDLSSDPNATANWVRTIVDEVQTHYGKLEPDDAFVHANTVKLNKPMGAMDTNFMGSIDTLIAAVERQAVRALKSMPLLFGMNDSTTETHANRQWEIHVAGIKSMQHMVESVLEGMLTIALQVQGIAADVVFRFAELRAAELMRDAQVELLKTTIKAKQVAEGWIDNDEAAEDVVGHGAVAEPERIQAAKAAAEAAKAAAEAAAAGNGTGAGNLPNVNADPGSERKLLSQAYKLAGLAECPQCKAIFQDDLPVIGSVGCPVCGNDVALRRGVERESTEPVM